MSDDLEQRIRQELVEVASRAPVVVGLARAATRRARRDRARNAAGVVAVVAVVVVCLTGGVWWHRAYSTQRPAPPASSPLPTALTPQQAVADALSRADRSVVADAVVHAGNPSAGPGVTIVVTVNAKSNSVAAVKAEWEADLLCGAAAEAMAGDQTSLKNVVGLCLTTARQPDGSSVSLGGGFGNARAGQQFTDASDAEISADVSALVASYGMNVERLQVLRPRNAAIVLEVSAPSVGVATRNGAALYKALRGTPARYAGIFFAIDVHGTTVGGLADAPRTADGYGWGLPEITGHVNDVLPVNGISGK